MKKSKKDMARLKKMEKEHKKEILKLRKEYEWRKEYDGDLMYQIVNNSWTLQFIKFLMILGMVTRMNVTARYAQDLNLEVIPVLNIPEVGNDFVTESASDQTLLRLKIAEWNAERGTNWQVLPFFIPS